MDDALLEKIQGRHYHTKDAGRLCGGSGVDRKNVCYIKETSGMANYRYHVITRPERKKRESSQRQTGPTRWRY